MKHIGLFIRIYLGFWLTIVIVVGVFIYMERLMTTEPMIKQWQKTIDNSVSFHAEEAAAIYERDGRDTLKNYFQRLEKTTGMKAYLLNEKGIEVTGQTLREDIRKQVFLAFQQTSPTYLRTEDVGIFTQRVKNPKGHTYLLAAVFPHPEHPEFGQGPPPHSMLSEHPPGLPPGLPPGPPPGLPPWPPPQGLFHNFLIRLIIGLIVSAIICYLLARYLTAPFLKLSSAARQWADGKLSVRVRPSFGSRNDELSSLANDFDFMAERIETLLTSQRNLLRDVSHELRSPLARLNVALELCRQNSSEQSQPHLDRIALETDRLNKLIGQILMYNKMHTETGELQKTRINLSEIAGEIVEDANYETNGSRAVLLSHEPVLLQGNYDLLRRAIENIVRNALYHTSDESPVEVSLTQSSEEGKAVVHITVRDHGRGVPEDALPLIFKPFFKIVQNEKHKTGAGLGLAISETAVRLHDGAITARNAGDGGLIVEICLPADAGTT